MLNWSVGQRGAEVRGMTFGEHTLARRRRDQRAIQPFNQAAQLRAGAARAAAGNDERTRGALEQTHGGVDYA